MIEAELALEAQIRHIPQVRSAEFFRVAIDLRPVEPGKQIAEGRTETKAAPTPVADVRDAPELVFDRGLVPKYLVFGIGNHKPSQQR